NRAARGHPRRLQGWRTWPASRCRTVWCWCRDRPPLHRLSDRPPGGCFVGREDFFARPGAWLGFSAPRRREEMPHTPRRSGRASNKLAIATAKTLRSNTDGRRGKTIDFRSEGCFWNSFFIDGGYCLIPQMGGPSHNYASFGDRGPGRTIQFLNIDK